MQFASRTLHACRRACRVRMWRTKPAHGCGDPPLQVYDLALAAALAAQRCGPRRLSVPGEWAWLLGEFSATYGIRDTYVVLAHLRWAVRWGPLTPAQSTPTPSLTCKPRVAHSLHAMLLQVAAWCHDWHPAP